MDMRRKDLGVFSPFGPVEEEHEFQKANTVEKSLPTSAKLEVQEFCKNQPTFSLTFLLNASTNTKNLPQITNFIQKTINLMDLKNGTTISLSAFAGGFRNYFAYTNDSKIINENIENLLENFLIDEELFP